MKQVEIMEDVREYAEGMKVEFLINKNNIPVIVAYNEAGYNATEVDTVDLIRWLIHNKPELVSREISTDFLIKWT